MVLIRNPIRAATQSSAGNRLLAVLLVLFANVASHAHAQRTTDDRRYAARPPDGLGHEAGYTERVQTYVAYSDSVIALVGVDVVWTRFVVR